MSAWMWAIVFKPLGLLVLFAPGALVVYWMKRHLKDGRLKRLLLFHWKV